jgi:predicted DNA-binding transcriptional regulator YafY
MWIAGERDEARFGDRSGKGVGPEPPARNRLKMRDKSRVNFRVGSIRPTEPMRRQRRKREIVAGKGRRQPNEDRIDGVARRLLQLIWIFSSRSDAISFRRLCDENPDLYPATDNPIRTFERDKVELKALGFHLEHGTRQDTGYWFERSGLATGAKGLPASTFPALRAIETMLESEQQFVERPELLMALAKLGGSRPGVPDSQASTLNRIQFRYPTDTHAFIAANLCAIETAMRQGEFVSFLHEAPGGEVRRVTLDPLATKPPYHVVGNVPGHGLRIFRLINLHGIESVKRPPGSREYERTPADLDNLLRAPSWRFPTHAAKPIVLEVDRSIVELADEEFPGAKVDANQGSSEQWLRYSLNSTNHDAVCEWVLMMGGELCRVVGPSEAKEHMRVLLSSPETSPDAVNHTVSNRRRRTIAPMPSGPGFVREIVALITLCTHNQGISLADAAKWLGQSASDVKTLLGGLNDAASDDPVLGFSIESNGKHSLVARNGERAMRFLHLTEREVGALNTAIDLIASAGLADVRSSAAVLRLWVQGRAQEHSSRDVRTVVRAIDPESDDIGKVACSLASFAERGRVVKVSYFDSDEFHRRISILVPTCVTFSEGRWDLHGHGLHDDAEYEISLRESVTVEPIEKSSDRPESSRSGGARDDIEIRSVAAEGIPFGRIRFKMPLAEIITRVWTPGTGRRAPDGSITVNHPYCSRRFFFAMLRRYGRAAELIGPDELRQEYLESLHRIRSYYEPRAE